MKNIIKEFLIQILLIFIVSALFISIVFISSIILSPTETTSTKNIVHEKNGDVKKKEQSKKIMAKEDSAKSKPAVESNAIVPYPHSDFKSYMYAATVTDTTSAQYQLISRAYIGDYGIMTVDGCYLVAMGTAYADYIGQKYQITFETGEVINAMVGDIKQDIHTDQYNSAGIDNSDLLEFIVAQPPQEVAIIGNYNVIFQGKVAYLTAF